MRRLFLTLLILFTLALLWLAMTHPARAGSCGYSSYSSYSYYPTYSYPTYSYNYTPSYSYTPTYKEVVKVKEVVIPTYAVVPLYSSVFSPSTYQPAAAPAASHLGARQGGDMAHASATAPAASPTMPSYSAPAAAPANHCAEATAKVAKLEAQLELLIKLMGPSGPPPGGPGAPPTLPRTPDKTEVPPPPKTPAPKTEKEMTSSAPHLGARRGVEEVMQQGVNTMYVACVKCHEKKVSEKEGGGFTIFDGNNVVNLTERQWAKIENEVTNDKMPPKKDAAGNAVPQLTANQKKDIVAFLAYRKEQATR